MDNKYQEQYKQAVKLIKEAVLSSQYHAARGSNAIQLSLYYGIGKYVSENSREGTWGKGAIEEISRELQKQLPGLRGFSVTNIKYMRQFYETWSDFLANAILVDKEKSSAMADEIKTDLILNEKSSAAADDLDMNEFLSIGFSHHIEIITKTKTLNERIFYIHQAFLRKWNKYTLRNMLKAKIFEHQGTLPNNFSQTLLEEKHYLRAVSMFRDEYLLDFVNVEELDVMDEEDIDERIIEHEIVKNIKNFILCLGSSFCFVGNQYRLLVGEEEFFVDLLFFNRDLRCMVAIELKKGKFKPAYLGQLNFYLSALDNTEKREGENPAIGLLLCKDMDSSVVELAIRDFNNPMGVATYRLPNEVPEEYKILCPIMEKARELLQEKGDDFVE